MSEQVAVSVLVPYYNAAEQIGRCLDSLLNQSLTSIEIIAVDDGSEDGSRAIVDEYAARYPGKMISVAKEHGGRSDTRNVALAHATGEFIGFVDSDDWVDPEMYEKLLASARSTGAELAVCDYAWLTETDPQPHLIHEGDVSEYGQSLAENPRIFTYCHGSLCNKLFSRRLFGTNSAFFPVGVDFEDLASVFGLLARANRIEKVDGAPLYFYVQGGPVSIMAACDERFLQIVDALAFMDSGFREDGAFERFSAELLRVNLLHLIFARYSDFFRSAPRALSFRFIDLAFAHLDRDFPGWRRSGITESFQSNPAYVFVSTHKPLLKAYVALLGRGK
jgi:glycosyltransferase involved in cell wall biosynthesis